MQRKGESGRDFLVGHLAHLPLITTSGVSKMRVIQLPTAHAEPITLFEAVGASSLTLADGDGEAHVHWLRFEPGGNLGDHPTGFGQILFVVEGSGWAAGADGRRIEIRTGQGVYFERGEHHSKGSDRGMTVLMIQVADLQLSAPVAKEQGQ